VGEKGERICFETRRKTLSRCSLTNKKKKRRIRDRGPLKGKERERERETEAPKRRKIEDALKAGRLPRNTGEPEKGRGIILGGRKTKRTP